jgi:hypothetical protein
MNTIEKVVEFYEVYCKVNEKKNIKNAEYTKSPFMNLIEINSVIKRVWDCANYDIISVKSDSIDKIRARPVFIYPKLKVIKEETVCPIIIISAPGAVGKTTFAKYFAFEKKAYYWDLSKLKLGDNTFIGTLASTFGAKNLSKILSDISEGNVSLFIDAFDEAEIISGWDGIEKFLIEVYDYCKSSPKTNIVLFSRSETAEFIQMTFDLFDDGKKYSMYEIDYFDKDGAIALVKEYLRLSGDTSFEIHNQPFNKALDNIFSAIAHGMDSPNENIWSDPETRSFIGYSPVLQTIATYLSKQNFEDVANQFEEKKSAEGGIQVIAKFIESLLIREQSKFVSSIKEAAENQPQDYDDWDSIYSPKEQMKSIISYLLNGNQIDASIFESVPNWLKKQYSSSITNFLPNHPFMRKGEFGPSFRDYSLGVLINDTHFGDVCRRYMSNKNIVLTSLFSHYYHKNNEGLCLGTDAGLIYESSVAKRGLDDSAILTYIKPEEGNKYSFEIIGSEGYKSSSLEFTCIIDNSTPLIFERRLFHAFIEINHDIILGKAGGSMELSDVEIKARKLIVRAKDFYFNCHSETSSTIKANDFLNEDFSVILKKSGDGALQFNWPNSEYFPWSDFNCDIDEQIYNTYKDELFSIRRILEPFRKHGRDEFAKQFEFIDNKMVGHVQERKDMLSYLIETKVLTKNINDRKYYLNADVLQSKGLNWSDLKTLSINQNLIKYIDGFKSKYSK